MKTLFYDNRRLLILAIFIILAAGLAAFNTMPRLEDPRLNTRNAIVVTRLPGASAARVESLITEKLEQELLEVPEIDNIESDSRANVSVLNVELKGSVVDVDPVWSKVRDRLADAEVLLPPQASKPDLDDLRGAAAFSMVIGLTWEIDETPNLTILNRLAEELETRMRIVPGTDLVRLYGEVEEEILVTVNPPELAALGLFGGSVAQQIEAADAKVAAGALRGRQSDALLEVEGEFDSLARVAEVPLAQTADGQTIRLGNVATVEKSPLDPPRQLALVEGKRGIVIAARVDDSRRVDLWAQRARQTVDTFEQALPSGVKLHRLFDQSVYTTQRLNDLAINLLMGAGIVILAILLTMGWRSALIVASALPMSIALVLFGLQMLGFKLHQMSITGMIIALGLLIDNAIVMVDEISTRRASGESPQTAIRHALEHLFVPLLGSTLTTIIAFMPIVLLTGNIGEFVGPMGVSVVLALMASFFVSMTIVPALAAMFSPGHQMSENWLSHGVQLSWLAGAFRGSLYYSLRYPVLGITIGIALPICGFLVASQLRDQFFPPADRDQFHIQVRLPIDSSIWNTYRVAEDIHQTLLDTPGIRTAHWYVGSSAPAVYYNMLMNEDDTPSFAQAVVQTDSAEETEALVIELQERLNRDYPGAQILVRLLGQGPPVDAPVEVRLYGPSLTKLRELGNELRGMFYQLPEVLHARGTLTDAEPKLWMKANEEETQLAGLDLRSVARQLQTNLEGQTGGSILEEITELPVRIRFADEQRSELDAIEGLNLVSASTQDWIPLSALGEWELRPERSGIPRRDARRCNTVKAYIHATALPKEVQADFQQRLSELGFELPPGYELEFGGDAEEQGEAIRSLAAYVGVLVLLMIATIVLSFNSVRMALLIGSIALFAVGLGLLSIWFSGYPFGFMAVIGTAGLIGVALNDSIVVLADIRASDPESLADPAALTNTVMGCTRHVVSTTLTTIGGFIPLLLDGGGFWPPLAIVMAGSVTGATILAVYFIPSAYRVMTIPARRGWLPAS